MSQPNKQRSRIWFVVLLVFFIAVFLVSAYKLITAEQIYKEGTDTYNAIANVAMSKPAPQPEQPSQPVQSAPKPVPEQVPAEQEQPEVPEEEEEPEIPYVPLLDIDFAALYDMNADTVGWLQMADTDINYPVVQGEDNDYYINHLFDGTQNKNGAIFLDFRNSDDFSDRNSFIYGHNMGNGAMFAVLLKYSVPGFYEEHPELILVTPEASFYLLPFSGYVTSASSDAYQIDFEDDAAFAEYLQRRYSLSEFTSDVVVSEEDQILTLSTCSYAFNNARYVLHCKLLPSYERTQVPET